MYSDNINAATVNLLIDGFLNKINMLQLRYLLAGRPDDCTVQLMCNIAAQMVKLCANSVKTPLVQYKIPQERCIDSLFSQLEVRIGFLASALFTEWDQRAEEGFIKDLFRVSCGRFAHCTSCTQQEIQAQEIQTDNCSVPQTEQPDKDLESSLSVELSKMPKLEEASEVETEPEEAAVASEEQKPSASPRGEPEGKRLLSTLLQAVLSQAAKESKACPLDSLHQHLLDQICSEIKTADLTLSPKALQDLAKDIFKDLCKEIPLNLREPTLDKLFISVFKKHLASTEKLVRESSEIKAQKQLSVDVCVEELVMRAFKKARVSYTDDTISAIKNRLVKKIWAEVQDIDFQPSSKTFKTSHKVIYKSLLKEWKDPECVMILICLNQQAAEEKVITTFKEHLMSAAAPAGRISRFMSFLGRCFGITRRQQSVSPL
ncbi:unnamed protein product [Oreochromis niloticus]|nr:unnamed protein product [Mustela putorius furo]